MDKKKIIWLSAIVASIVIVAVLIVNLKVVSKTEKIKIDEVSKELNSYIYNLDDKNYSDVEKYILFALDYAYNNDNKNELTVDEIASFASSKFSKTVTSDDILSYKNLSDEMVKRGIIFNLADNKYTINQVPMTNKEIADTPIYAYKTKKVSKVSKDKFKVVYEKYIIENPYEVLNYYNDENVKNESNQKVYNNNGESINVDAPFEKYDTKEILEYLSGEKRRSAISKHINAEVLDRCGKKVGTTNITYVVKDNTLKIEKIKVKK